jgi:drug/metabolite transporter (DMT)-like permease
MAVQFIGVALLVGLALLTGEPAPTWPDIGVAVAAGLTGAIGLGALYQGLALGQMGVVAPLSAVVGGVIPILVALVTEGRASTPQMIGFGMALAAVWLLAGTGEFRANPREIILAVIAGIGFGFYFALIALASSDNIYWTLFAARLAAGLFFLTIILITRRPVAPRREAWGLTGLAGLTDAGGNLLFVLAAQTGRLDVVAVLASLFPGTTVFLARVFLGERLTRMQVIGVVAALAAVALIAL